ncbi:MAG TPA: PepSY domain-containing protein [Gemmatimonadaceae bacterium]|nr:PepSY domain-containing protein [Gemmatimonadaceae bacterium]
MFELRKHSLHSVLVLSGMLVAAPLAAQTAQTARQSTTYKRDLPAALVKEATVAEADAANTASARVPAGRIESVELEREGGKLIYSYDIKVPGHSGVEEVTVDAMTGAVVSTEHETPKTERKEAAQERKERAKKEGAKKARAKKPKQ